MYTTNTKSMIMNL